VKKTILTDFSFAFPADRNVGIMGKNGAGKSTMMRLMGALNRLTLAMFIGPLACHGLLALAAVSMEA
jgi:ABC-type polysaccharide/polyol phosphate transport system ATPase subunit